ncbi:MAG TPA: PEP-CTERM sorting domain-containing protein, partial [Gemmataceae bacterium]|nr:PEP-CTERM sorting domain-containing protein [Gemmataceae bacterium]
LAMCLVATAPVSAAFWFPFPTQPSPPGNVPLPPDQVAPNNNPSNPIGDPPPPDVTPDVNLSSPEPASVVLGLVGAGAMGLVGVWRRRRLHVNPSF